jgi:hypothetical protein
MKLYHYNCDGFDDTGFGCVYRNAQTCLSAMGVEPVPSIQSMMQHFHGPMVLSRYRSVAPVTLWIEPYDVEMYLGSQLPRVATRAVCYSPTADMVYTACHRTPRFVYGSANTFFDFDRYLAECREHLTRVRPGVPILIDNGVYSFCLKEVTDRGVVIIDPHVQSPERAERTLVDLAYMRSNVWYTLMLA